MTQDQLKEATRTYLKLFLPDALKKALESYQVYVTSTDDKVESNDFKDHHNACKVAISHIELLLKLVQWAEIPIDNNQEKSRADQLSKMVTEAQKHLTQHQEK